MELNLKRTLTCIILTVFTTLSTHAQTLCVIDGTPLPDTLLHVTIDEMRSDSAKEIVAKDWDLFRPTPSSPYRFSQQKNK